MSERKNFISLAKHNPELLNEWHPTLNGATKPDDVSYGSSKKFWWVCIKGHTYESSPNSRSQGRGCPICAQQTRGSSHTKNWINKYGSLAEKNPDLAKEWHPTKNGDLTAHDVAPNAGKKAWWICEKGHEWEAAIYSRNQGIGCPYCANKKVLVGFNDLATINPSLAKEWHPIKNGKLKPTEVTLHNAKSVWWVCEKGHEWKSKISNRSNGNNCPICIGKKVLSGFNDLATVRPDLAKEWNPIKNGKLKPTEVTAGSNKKVWWLCDKGHEWEASLAKRTAGRGCPICATESRTSFPEQAIFYYFKQISTAYNRFKLDLRTEIDIYLPEYKIGVEYDGIYYHKGEESICREISKNNKLNKAGIKLIRVKESYDNFTTEVIGDTIYIKPGSNNNDLNKLINRLINHVAVLTKSEFCVDINVNRDRFKIYEQYILGEKESSLSALRPILAKEWHPTKNGKLVPENVSYSSNKTVWWLCSQGHEWQATINSRAKGVGCPYCSGYKPIKGVNDLATMCPEIAKEWHPTKNGDLKPTEILSNSNKKVWWICKKGHEWKTIVSHRTRGGSCPVCSGKQVLTGYNDLVTTNPSLAKEWHPTKNGNLKPFEITRGSDKKAWWICEKGHEWEAVISSRNQGVGCPYCASQKVLVGYNDLATTNPSLAKEWHPTKNGELTPSNMLANSNKKAWWICEKGHEWEAVISSRNQGVGCPYCANKKVLVGLNDLATTNPSLAKEWHPKKNGKLKPTEVTAGSNKKVWWLCDKGHEWSISINTRNGGNSCPYCSNQKVLVGYNDLATTNPSLAKEWHPTKNGDLKPTDVVAGSNKKVWWLCSQGHEWQAMVSTRNKGSGCMACYRQRRNNKNKEQKHT